MTTTAGSLPQSETRIAFNHRKDALFWLLLSSIVQTHSDKRCEAVLLRFAYLAWPWKDIDSARNEIQLTVDNGHPICSSLGNTSAKSDEDECKHTALIFAILAWKHLRRGGAYDTAWKLDDVGAKLWGEKWWETTKCGLQNWLLKDESKWENTDTVNESVESWKSSIESMQDEASWRRGDEVEDR